MLLVMYTSGAFTKSPPYQAGEPEYNELWSVTWQRISLFLPNLRMELFPPPPPPLVDEYVEVEGNSETVAVAEAETVPNEPSSSSVSSETDQKA